MRGTLDAFEQTDTEVYKNILKIQGKEYILELLSELFGIRRIYSFIVTHDDLLAEILEFLLNVFNKNFYKTEILLILLKINENIIRDFGENVITRLPNDNKNENIDDQFYNQAVINYNTSTFFMDYANDENDNEKCLIHLKFHICQIFEKLFEVFDAVVSNFIEENEKKEIDNAFISKTNALGLVKYILKMLILPQDL